jgi:hypothetical protein
MLACGGRNEMVSNIETTEISPRSQMLKQSSVMEQDTAEADLQARNNNHCELCYIRQAAYPCKIKDTFYKSIPGIKISRLKFCFM